MCFPPPVMQLDDKLTLPAWELSVNMAEILKGLSTHDSIGTEHSIRRQTATQGHLKTGNTVPRWFSYRVWLLQPGAKSANGTATVSYMANRANGLSNRSYK